MRDMQDSYDDMNFTPPSLSRITASTLIVYGDRDPLYPVEMAIAMYRPIPQSFLWWFQTAVTVRCLAMPLLNSPDGARLLSNYILETDQNKRLFRSALRSMLPGSQP